MKKPELIISELEAVSGRLEKEAIIKQAALENNAEFFSGCRLAIDCMVTFGVKQVPTHAGPDGAGLSWSLFEQAATDLKNRAITGNAARDLIQDLMRRATVAEWNNWYRRILIKDLRCGVSEKTINKVVGKNPQYHIPVFTCQLAHDSANHEEKVRGKRQIEVKLDGCLSEDWIIEFENGEKIKIKEVVDKQLKGKVKSYNTITGKIEYNNILNWAKDGMDDAESEYEWFEITLDDGTVLPPLTGNHLVYIPALKCYRRVDLLTEGDEVLLS